MKKFKALLTKIKVITSTAVKTVVATVGMIAATAAVPVFATATPVPSTDSITINFEPSQMFTYSNVIISCLMPVVYITAGLSLGFTIIYALKGAFSNRM